MATYRFQHNLTGGQPCFEQLGPIDEGRKLFRFDTFYSYNGDKETFGSNFGLACTLLVQSQILGRGEWSAWVVGEGGCTKNRANQKKSPYKHSSLGEIQQVKICCLSKQNLVPQQMMLICANEEIPRKLDVVRRNDAVKKVDNRNYETHVSTWSDSLFKNKVWEDFKTGHYCKNFCIALNNKPGRFILRPP